MVIRTDICTYSELRIYPGRGQRFIAKDGRGFLYLSKKCRVLSLRKVKAQDITWCTAWRRAHKKIKTEEISKKRRKRGAKQQRQIVGVSLEQIQATRNQKSSEQKAQAEQVLREIKDRKVKADQKRAATKLSHGQKAAQKQQQKAQSAAQKKMKGGKRK